MLDAFSAKRVVTSLVAQTGEGEWFEFKQNNDKPQEIGEYVSALANGASLNDKPYGLLVWGVEDEGHRVVGTDFDPFSAKNGNEPLHTWLERMCTPRVTLRFHTVQIEEKNVVVLEITPAGDRPLAFAGQEWVRVGPSKRKLQEFPDRERKLWTRSLTEGFERSAAHVPTSYGDLSDLIDIEVYRRLSEFDEAHSETSLAYQMVSDGIMFENNDGYSITNLGAILLARDLRKFPSVAQKNIRVVIYNGSGRSSSIKVQHGGLKGYACGFVGLLNFISQHTPQAELIVNGRRQTQKAYPDLAVREAVANAMIHQDFLAPGGGPLIEVFDGRVEITNPGIPLVDPDRFIDSPSTPRNASFAAIMRKFKFCEELGGGVDKIVSETEVTHLPAPDFREIAKSVRVTLFAPKDFSDMEREDKVRACYQHASLKWEDGRKAINNTSLRERFGLPEEQYSAVSRIITESTARGLIKPRDPDNKSRKHASYIPHWAK